MNNELRQNILIGLLIIAIFAVVGFSVRSSMPSSGSQAAEEEVVISEAPESSAKVDIEDIITGTGAEAKSGDTVVVNYVGTLPDGTQFDSSYDRGEPYETAIGTGVVIKGWDLGIPGMKVGGKRKLTVPAELGYGAQGQGNIPPNSPLIFEVELLEIK